MAAVPIPDPSRRQNRRISDGEIKSPFRAVDYVVPERRYQQAGEGHFFQVVASRELGS